ncbi:MAG: dihydroorotase [Eubacteriales bacterium]|nr:dihydroorotase [Eubacteriales bacterium]
MNLFIGNGLIVDAEYSSPVPAGIVIADGIITEVIFNHEKKEQSILTEPDKTDKRNIYGEREADIFIDAGGKWIVPGLIDLHVHLRDPGFEYKEDIYSGCAAAARGGFTTVCCMPNTSPVIDSPEIVRMIDKKARGGNGVQILCIGAITKKQEGNELADYEEMLSLQTISAEMTGRGICGISEDGMSVKDEGVMLAAMRKAKELGLTVYSHAEPEAAIVERDIKLAEQTGCRLHFCHISQKRSIELIREAKKNGSNVTAETAPHYFTLDSSQVNGDPNKKMNPPLRNKEDVEAVIAGLKDGTLDVISTDHAPHHEREKSLSFADAPNGVVGLETSFQLGYTRLVKTGILTPLALINKMSTKPAEILGTERGRIQVGQAADLAIIDVEKQYVISPSDFLSKGKNSPFIGMNVYGSIEYTIIGGKIVWKNTKSDQE